MKVCTFLGDPFRIYDEVTQRIEEALEEILAAHGEMELYFHGWFGEFPRACAAAALRVKGRHPDRIVTLTLAVSAQWQEEPAVCCVFDRIIRIPVLENSPDMGRHRLLQAILRRCDCLISYVYLELRGEEAQILSSVRRRRRLTVLDVTDPDTAAYLKEHIRALPREERLVFQAGDRVQRRAVSEELGISTASLSKMAYKTRVALLKQLIARYEMMRREGALPLVVGLMHLKAGPDVVFEVIDRFLASECGRIVPREGIPEGDIAAGSAVIDEELATEELAEIYLAQGLNDRARAIYAKLSLLYPEKSVYFATIIARIDGNGADNS